MKYTKILAITAICSVVLLSGCVAVVDEPVYYPSYGYPVTVRTYPYYHHYYRRPYYYTYGGYGYRYHRYYGHHHRYYRRW